MPTPASERPNCLACLHFYITHEASRPYGCRALGFKSLQYPSMVVFASSGIHCQVFSAKNRRTQTEHK
ncbi:uracil-DNA glycosylase [Thiovibrio frasassiensis]|uniref:Uracil-DNA glycosylase n=1 Tax=Thiovibrio frasassiensis TaxID=2984131 RepID=A0A9X4MFR3_9BACT|nr:uracil-DNA glycosylase [Thiovibrio frasassiensis]MDG4474703.1 uracil-DNA glycosylase [Thiovibrio frasassiensis]